MVSATCNRWQYWGKSHKSPSLEPQFKETKVQSGYQTPYSTDLPRGCAPGDLPTWSTPVPSDPFPQGRGCDAAGAAPEHQGCLHPSGSETSGSLGRMSPCTRNYSWCNNIRQAKVNGLGRKLKLSLFKDIMIIHMDNLKESKKKKKSRIKWVWQVHKIQVNTEKAFAFLCTSNEQ